MASDFQAVGFVPNPQPHTKMNCPECGFAVGRMKPNLATEIHIKNVGWV